MTQDIKDTAPESELQTFENRRVNLKAELYDLFGQRQAIDVLITSRNKELQELNNKIEKLQNPKDDAKS